MMAIIPALDEAMMLLFSLFAGICTIHGTLLLF